MQSSEKSSPSSQQPIGLRTLPQTLFARALYNLNLGGKLSLSFGILVAFTFLMLGLNYLAGQRTVQKIQKTQKVSVPLLLTSEVAQ
ncbi:MAG: hypothetical protein F6K11_36160, partial [Leptolyngbya sp. SIO3F4]|nr:hypothetical protein [Leptolyngbya sp. SIO3F4]